MITILKMMVVLKLSKSALKLTAHKLKIFPKINDNSRL